MDNCKPCTQQDDLPPIAARGAFGERLAAEFLVAERRYRIIARNWRNPADEREEIDLIVMDEDILVFVEVKTRHVSALVPGFFHVGPAKKKVLRRAAKAFLRLHRPKPRTFRLDVVEVELGAGSPTIRHYASIPLFGRYDIA